MADYIDVKVDGDVTVDYSGGNFVITIDGFGVSDVIADNTGLDRTERVALYLKKAISVLREFTGSA